MSRRSRLGQALICALMLGACATAPPARPPAPQEPNFAQGITYVVDDLFAQLRRLPAFSPREKTGIERAVEKVVGQEAPARRSVIVVDVVLESSSGQQTRATELAEATIRRLVGARLPQFEIVPMRPEALSGAEYLVSATMTPVARESSVHRLSLAMTEVRSALVIAQAGVRLRDATLDTTPTAFYRDSPAAVRDRLVEGLARTAETRPGGQADSIYLERLSTSALVNEGLAAFNRDDFAGALRFYEEASKRADGQQLRIYSGLYMSYWNQRREKDAEAAFSRIVSLGLATNNLAVKFLFRPGRTDFTPEHRISGPYPFWLRQIAHELSASHTCLAVIGHSSNTGTEDYNDRLSLARAEAMKALLLAESGGLAQRLRTSGVGFRENIVGTGTDDQRDALDRRVEFRVVDCGQH